MVAGILLWWLLLDGALPPIRPKRTASFLFNLSIKALNWILIAILSCTFVLHCLDELFFAILPPTNDALIYSQHFDDLCAELGLSVNHSKDAIGTTANVLGIEFDFNLI